MKYQFDRELFISNLNEIMKVKGLKNSELEDFACISKGSISRITKPGSTAAISKEFIISLAQALQVSVETLVLYDFSKNSSTVKTAIEFLSKLREKTIDNRATWCEENAKDLGSVCVRDEASCCSHPLFIPKRVDNIAYPEYASLFTISEVKLIDSIYHTPLDEATSLYMAKVFYDDNEHIELYFSIAREYNEDRMSPYEDYYQEYLYDVYKVHRFLTTDDTSSEINDLVNDIFFLVQNKNKHVEIPADVADIVQTYIDDLPF